jgi:arsenical pump membrane protein
MMLLAELARLQGLFDYLAAHAVTASKGSPTRLFTLIYLVGTAVTVLLSNDATAVVLTPAVYTAVKKARGAVLPYLFICAFIANAASFVLPISNPANLVIFGKHMPPLLEWLRAFSLPSLLSVTVTYFVLRFLVRKELREPIHLGATPPELSSAGRLVAFGIAATAIVLIIASALNADLGLPTCIAAVVVLGCVLLMDRTAFVAVVKDISWGVLPLVAGLFVIVQALDTAGAIAMVRDALQRTGSLPAGFGVALLCNIANNLPVGLLVGSAVQGHVTGVVRDALVIGVDLGPNLSITGSLATILWLIALRREGLHVGFRQFLRLGICVTFPALFLALCALLIG